jgi:hypothetical protein
VPACVRMLHCSAVYGGGPRRVTRRLSGLKPGDNRRDRDQAVIDACGPLSAVRARSAAQIQAQAEAAARAGQAFAQTHIRARIAVIAGQMLVIILVEKVLDPGGQADMV